MVPFQFFSGKARDTASGLGALSLSLFGFNVFETAALSDQSVSGGFFTLVTMRFFDVLLPSHQSYLLHLGSGVIGFSLATIPKVNCSNNILMPSIAQYSHPLDSLPCSPRLHGSCWSYFIYPWCRLFHHCRLKGGSFI